MTRTIDPVEAQERYGISTAHQVMPNGERRFRLVDRNGLGYIRTEAGSNGAWQDSHLHKRLLETYIVQEGWIAIAELSGSDELRIEMMQAGSMWTAPLGVAHNVYVSAGTCFHVVKHGNGTSDDWVTSEKTQLLNSLSKGLPESEILRLLSSKR